MTVSPTKLKPSTISLGFFSKGKSSAAARMPLPIIKNSKSLKVRQESSTFSTKSFLLKARRVKLTYHISFGIRSDRFRLF